ncbi:hypothetical protein [Paenibacillus ferrarius]|uniref:hypothetical protein n=1 Tax=Paenibacillus ferrarius TaxID=1469647 RepID=UPI003D28C1FC
MLHRSHDPSRHKPGSPEKNTQPAVPSADAAPSLSPSGVLHLQRMYGNRAVTQLFRSTSSPGPLESRNTPQSSSAVIQRKNLEQAGLNANMENSGTRALVTDGRVVNFYTAEAPAEAASKVEALKKSGEMNAVVGKRVDEHAQNTWGRDSNSKWTEPSEELNKDTLNKVDPFFYGVKIPFKHAGKTETLELSFQHAKNWTGYVENIYDSTNKDTASVPTMFDSGTEHAEAAGKMDDKGHYRNLKFSNVHDKADKAKIIDLTAGGAEKNLDAYTKIAGEGARWQCVRNHAANVQNDSYFFTRDTTKPNKVLAVSFRSLWLSWKNSFQKKYDISDATVIAALSSGALGSKYLNLSKMREGTDYDLDAGKSFSKS